MGNGNEPKKWWIFHACKVKVQLLCLCTLPVTQLRRFEATKKVLLLLYPAV
jgi:hypothetical protein